MAVFGNLSQIAFPEVIKLLKRRCGCVVFETNQIRYEMHINQGRLVGARINDQRVPDRSSVNEMLNVLKQIQEGTFVFSAQAPEILLDELDIVLEPEMFSARFENTFHLVLPHADTRFKYVQTSPPEDLSLGCFLEKAKPLLSVGASSNEIAKYLAVDVGWVQYYIYRLRLIDLVQPIREATNAGRSQRAQRASSQKPNLLKSLINILHLRSAR